MAIFRMSDMMTFFMVIGIAIIFVAVWMVTSERRRNILKAEIKKLKIQQESYEREKFILLEKITLLENTQSLSDQANWAANPELERSLEESRERLNVLQSENDALKRELNEARGSLEEVYKALG